MRTLVEARWLVIGHGSVGSFVTGRLTQNGGHVSVLDPHPRVPIPAALGVTTIEPRAYDYAISCVPPDVAEEVPGLLAGGLAADGILFDWNTVAPAVKHRIAESHDGDTVDVALLDTVDGAGVSPQLAISGARTEAAAELLEGAGFRVSIAGDAIGQAAALKYLRSIFMKTLEALALEFAALSSSVDDQQIVRSSLENNLGSQFVSFMDLLLATNRIHAERRAGELADAVAAFTADGQPPQLAATAVEVMREAADAWGRNPPEAAADVAELASHLRKTLWPQTASR